MTKRIVTVLGIALLSSAAAVSVASIAWAAAAPANMRGYMMQTVAPAVQPIWDFKIGRAHV